MTGKKSLRGEFVIVPNTKPSIHHVPEQVQEPKYLHDEPNERPFEEYE